MNVHARDAVIAASVCAVVCVAMVVTQSADVLWILLLLAFFLAVT